MYEKMKVKSKLAHYDPSVYRTAYHSISAVYGDCHRVQAALGDDNKYFRNPFPAEVMESQQFRTGHGSDRLLAFSGKQPSGYYV